MGITASYSAKKSRSAWRDFFYGTDQYLSFHEEAYSGRE